MMTVKYQGSRGPMEIASMPLPYAQNALSKLQREREDDTRDAEIEALAAHIAAAAEAELESEASQ